MKNLHRKIEIKQVGSNWDMNKFEDGTPRGGALIPADELNTVLRMAACWLLDDPAYGTASPKPMPGNYNRKIEIKQRSVEAGSDWDIKFYENDIEDSGAVLPQGELDNAIEMCRCWLIHRPYARPTIGLSHIYHYTH